MSLVEAIDYTDASLMLADYAERRKRMYARPVVVRIVEPAAPVEPQPEPEPQQPRYSPSVEAIIERYRRAHPGCKLFAQDISRAHRAIEIPDGAAVIRIACVELDVTRVDLESPRRTAKVINKRHITFWLMRHFTTLSLPQIGKLLGGRDHTTVLHGVKRIDGLRSTDPELRDLTDRLADAVKLGLGRS